MVAGRPSYWARAGAGSAAHQPPWAGTPLYLLSPSRRDSRGLLHACLLGGAAWKGVRRWWRRHCLFFRRATHGICRETLFLPYEQTAQNMKHDTWPSTRGMHMSICNSPFEPLIAHIAGLFSLLQASSWPHFKQAYELPSISITPASTLATTTGGIGEGQDRG